MGGRPGPAHSQRRRVIDNFKLGTLDAMGLRRRLVRGERPDGRPLLDHRVRLDRTQGGKPGYDFILQAETGLMAITGEPDGTPMKLGVAIVDICTGMLATIAILGALPRTHAHRSRSAMRGESA